jgi:hypothetical protein
MATAPRRKSRPAAVVVPTVVPHTTHRLEVGMDSDMARDWARAQTTQPSAAVVQFLSFESGFKLGTVSRTKAQRAFARAFPSECTEAFDGICRCDRQDMAAARRAVAALKG